MAIRSRNRAFRLLQFVTSDNEVDATRYNGYGELLLHDVGAWFNLNATEFVPGRVQADDVYRRYIASREDAERMYNMKRDTKSSDAVGEKHDATHDATLSEKHDATLNEKHDATLNEKLATLPCDTTTAETKSDPMPALRQDHECQQQQFAVVALVDFENVQLIRPHGTFESTDECTEYIANLRKEAANRHVDFFVVSMYQWLYPHVAASCKDKRYLGKHGDVLSKIMNQMAHRTRPGGEASEQKVSTM